MPMLQSIRARLTLWLVLLIALCMAAFALYLYVTVTATLTTEIDHTIRVQARQVAATYDFAPADPSGGAGQPIDIGPVEQFARAGIFIETFDLHGHVLARSSNLGRLSLPSAVQAAARTRSRLLFTQPVPGGALRVYSLPALQRGRLMGVVLVAASLNDVRATTHALLALLVIGGLGTLLLAALGSGMLVRRGLYPLDEMAIVAEGITAHRLDQRLGLRNPPREIGRLARTFDAMLDRLHDAFAAQRRFVADASHELRTPLAVIRGRGEVLLLKDTLDAETREGLSMMRDEAGRMGRLVANLLLLARGDESLTIDQRPVELDVLMLEVARQGRVLAQGIAVTVGHEDQALVLGDADLLKQLLLNLVDNAVTYTPREGHVELSLAVMDGQARLSVRDTGPGIAPEELQRIFERFYRPDRARSRRDGGAGLGLAIARWIAEVHGGRIEVESSLGHGSTFALVLPLLSNRPLTIS